MRKYITVRKIYENEENILEGEKHMENIDDIR